MWSKEDALTINLLLSMLEIEPNIDKFNSWMLGGVGATAALVVTNIGSIKSATKVSAPSLFLALLAVSALFGFLAKVNGIKARNAKTLFQCILSSMEGNQETNVSASLESYLSAFPIWVRFFMERGARKGEIDPLFGFKKAVNFVLMQGVYTTLQGLMFIMFIVSASLSLK